ncbi:Hypothetical protein SMAX5B_015737 [Scophthalmus maximus]|uniref:Uncharacterized protein n=1 Tax=Scophthalmus maximus TaxID=52904 RepID=A0A2U9CYP3_SCOMX|nr:Hypothetical protein SMAX5B_015737 [Scophthalmus maximus]
MNTLNDPTLKRKQSLICGSGRTVQQVVHEEVQDLEVVCHGPEQRPGDPRRQREKQVSRGPGPLPKSRRQHSLTGQPTDLL